MSRFIGVDLGTTFLKGAVLDLDRCGVSSVRRAPMPGPVAGLPPTRYELDPAAVTQAVRTLIAELLADAPDAAGLLLSSQMHGVVLTDEQGRARSTMITWKDQRALEPSDRGTGTVFDEICRLVSAEQQAEIGGELRVGVPITTLYHLRQQNRLPPDSYPASVPDFVLASLCGVAPTTEPTNAAAHGLYFLASCDWHRGVIARLGLDSLRWPRIRPFGEQVGAAAIDGRTLRCFTPVGDQQCALVGAGLGLGELSLNIATGSQASLLSTSLPRGEFQVRPYFDGRWLRTIVQIPAGRSLGLLVDFLSEIARSAGGNAPDPWAYIGQAVEPVLETDLEVDLGFFGSLTGDGGRIAHVHEGNLTVGHVFAAAFRWMANQYAQAARRLSSSREWDRVTFSGGLAQKSVRLRRETLAQLGNPPSRLCSNEEDTLEGLLALALVCAGRAATVEQASQLVSAAGG